MNTNVYGLILFFSSCVGKRPAFDQLIRESQRFLCRCFILSQIKMHPSLKIATNDKDIRLWGHMSSYSRHSGIALSVQVSPMLVPHSNIFYKKKKLLSQVTLWSIRVLWRARQEIKMTYVLFTIRSHHKDRRYMGSRRSLLWLMWSIIL